MASYWHVGACSWRTVWRVEEFGRHILLKARFIDKRRSSGAAS